MFNIKPIMQLTLFSFWAEISATVFSTSDVGTRNLLVSSSNIVVLRELKQEMVLCSLKCSYERVANSSVFRQFHKFMPLATLDCPTSSQFNV